MNVLSKRNLTILLLAVALAVPTRAADQRPADHVTADVVSVDVTNRTLVIRVSGGPPQTAELDDSIGGFGDVKGGDRVILTLRKEPGRARVTWMIREAGRKKDGKDGVIRANPVSTNAPGPDAEAAGRVFADRAAALSEDANRVDGLWRSFRDGCEVAVTAQYDGAREWLSLWDTQAKADLSSGFCRDLFDQIVSTGSDVNKSMAAAEDAARKSLLPGSIRDIRRRYSMDWDGWGRPAPERLEEK